MNGDSLKELEQKVKEDFELKEKSKLLNLLVEKRLEEFEKQILLTDKETCFLNFIKILEFNTTSLISFGEYIYDPKNQFNKVIKITFSLNLKKEYKYLTTYDLQKYELQKKALNTIRFMDEFGIKEASMFDTTLFHRFMPLRAFCWKQDLLSIYKLDSFPEYLQILFEEK